MDPPLRSQNSCRLDDTCEYDVQQTQGPKCRLKIKQSMGLFKHYITPHYNKFTEKAPWTSYIKKNDDSIDYLALIN